jgi:septal ring factor EnvC (AmiA/AmiB activator)
MKKVNGVVKWPLLTIGIITLLFGSNILGPAIREHFVGQTKQEAVASDVEELKEDVEQNKAVLDSHAANLAEHETGIAVIQQKIDGIDERTKETREDVREIRKLIIQGR